MSDLVVFDRKPYARSLRCICGYPKEAHTGDALACPRPNNKAATFGTMNLPEGKTCGDCVHIRRCNAIFGHMATDEHCDWFPSKFRASETKGGPA